MIKRIGMPTSDDTILRCLKRRVKARGSEETPRVVGVDDWAWRKGSAYGTIIVDLERREVLDLFPELAAGMTADWLKRHPGVEIISRDRCGSFAQGAHEGAPQAQQIADRFHILQNLREAVQAQLGRAVGLSARPLLPAEGEEVASVRDKHGGAEHRRLTRVANQRSRQAVFDRVRALHKEGRNVMDIARQTGFDRRTVAKWIRAEALPQRSASAPKTTSPWHFEDYLSRRWSEGCVPRSTIVPGNQGARLHRQFFKSRTAAGEMAQSEIQDCKDHIDCSESATCRSPATGRSISPMVAAALCVKQRGLLTADQATKVDEMKKDWPEFATMRRLAMRFRGLLKSKSAGKLGAWLRDAQKSGLYAMQRFSRTLQRDIEAVRNAITEPWSNGQTEGQINRLKALKRTMYGRAGPELLRARLLPV